jgi:hypothetical protein
MSTSPQHGGSSKRGPHRLASTACERLWTLRTVYGLITKYDPPNRLQGTLIHTCLAYHYASLMAKPPDWFHKKSLSDALEDDGEGHPELVRVAKEVYEAFKHRFAGDTWKPVFVEEEFEATIGELDPGGPDSTLDSEIVTCRTDLVIESNGDLWIVDHKSTGGGYGGKDRLDPWKDDGEWKMNWQVLMNLHILRAPSNVKKLGGRMIRGFVIQRVKQRPPYDFDRNLISVPALAYQAVPRAAREYVAKERSIMGKIARGETPTPNFSSCWGRYGKCDYHDLCASGTKQEQQAIMNSSFRSTHDMHKPIAGAPSTIVTIGGMRSGGGKGV